jgi:hypothetical protein
MVFCGDRADRGDPSSVQLLAHLDVKATVATVVTVVAVVAVVDVVTMMPFILAR